tara:strand:- start:728 stop:1042 length:315 start_codon:yes stop_codon:yes gene_type:complete
MRVFFICLLISASIAEKIDVRHCPEKSINGMVFHVCKDVEDYSNIYFHDFTGENKITVIPDRLYRNHNEYVAFSSNKYLYVAKNRYSKPEWDESLKYLVDDSKK